MDYKIETPKFSLPKYDKAETIRRIKDIIPRYNQQGDFILEKIEYRDEEFGNILIDLGTKSDLHFCFFRDRYQVYATVEVLDKTRRFDLDNVLDILGIKYTPVSMDTDIVEATERFMQILVENLSKLQEAFSPKNRSTTTKKVDSFLEDRLKKELESRQKPLSQ